jgi:hypothetical protein
LYNKERDKLMDVEGLLSFAGSVCGNEVWEEIIPYLKNERAANNNIAEDAVFSKAIDTAQLRLTIYQGGVNA